MATPDEEKELNELLQGYDDERHISELRDMEVTLVGTSVYIPSATKATMDSNNGAPVMAVRTKTYEAEKKVTCFACLPSAPGARKVRMSKTMGCGYIGFGIPLAKLGLSFPPGRRVTLNVQARQVKDLWVYDISFKQFENEPRHLSDPAQAKEKRTRRKPPADAAG